MHSAHRNVPLAGITLDPRLQPRAALDAKATRGLRRKNADKRRQVMMALSIPDVTQWSDRRIANHCGVSPSLVADVRQTFDASKSEWAGLFHCGGIMK